MMAVRVWRSRWSRCVRVWGRISRGANAADYPYHPEYTHKAADDNSGLAEFASPSPPPGRAFIVGRRRLPMCAHLRTSLAAARWRLARAAGSQHRLRKGGAKHAVPCLYGNPRDPSTNHYTAKRSPAQPMLRPRLGSFPSGLAGEPSFWCRIDSGLRRNDESG